MRPAATASFLTPAPKGRTARKFRYGARGILGAVPPSERQRARRRALSWLLLAAAMVAGAAFVFWRSRHAVPPEPPLVEPLSVVPAGPAFVLTVDVARLRRTALGRELIGKELARLATAQARPARERCESALSAEVDRLAIAVPANDPKASTSTPATLGVIAAGRFHKDPALRCAAGTAGNLDATVRATIGSFETRRDPRTAREVAAREGLLIESDATYFRALLDRAEQQQARTTEAEDARDRLHAELRRVVGQNAPIVLSLVLPRGWLAQLLGDPEAEASPFAEIRAAALRVEVADTFTVSGTLRCDQAEACARLERFLAALKSDLGALNVGGAASLLGKLSLVRRDAALDFSGTFGPTDLDQLNAVALPPAAPPSAPLPAASGPPPRQSSPP